MNIFTKLEQVIRRRNYNKNLESFFMLCKTFEIYYKTLGENMVQNKILVTQFISSVYGFVFLMSLSKSFSLYQKLGKFSCYFISSFFTGKHFLINIVSESQNLIRFKKLSSLKHSYTFVV